MRFETDDLLTIIALCILSAIWGLVLPTIGLLHVFGVL
jgi:hypothetical protein